MLYTYKILTGKSFFGVNITFFQHRGRYLCFCICFDVLVIAGLKHYDLFEIYCAPPNLGITRTWICQLNFAERPIFQAWVSLTSLKSQARGPQLKVPPGGLVLRIFTSWKSPSTSAGFKTHEPWISRRARFPRQLWVIIIIVIIMIIIIIHVLVSWSTHLNNNPYGVQPFEDVGQLTDH